MSAAAFVIRSTRIVAEGAVRPGVIHVRGEKIERVEFGGADARIGEPGHPGKGQSVLDVGDLVVMPGLVDTHVHINEPGRTDWEGFVTAGRAAAAGGITTIVVMPLNCTPAATNVALMGEAAAAAGKCLVDYGFWGGLVPGNVDQLEPMWEAGALGFKAFMVESGVEDFGEVCAEDLDRAMPVLGRLGAPLLVHAESPDVLERARIPSKLDTHPTSYSAYEASRPREAEIRAVRTLMAVARRHLPTQVHCHVVHVSCDDVAQAIAEGRRDLSITAETCPHYFAFDSHQIKKGQTLFKCAPPIRRRFEMAWECLNDGLLDLIASDHSPCPPEMNELDSGDFTRAWGGISSLQLTLPVAWTEARRSSYGDLAALSGWLSLEAPAKLAGINYQKGNIAPGHDADLVIFDPDGQWTVRAEALQHRHKLTPYDGMTLRGVVKRTILRGRTIYDADAANQFPTEPIGRWIKRGST